MRRLLSLVFTFFMLTVSVAAQSQPSFKTVHDVPYVFYDGAWLLMDIDIPVNQGSGPFPAIISVHAGGWLGGGRQGTGGRRESYRGYVIARPDYRLSGTWKFPAAIHDLKAAVRFLRKHAPTYRIKPDKIGVWGQSSGGHLAALLGVSGGVAYLEGTRGTLGVDSRVQAVVDVTGPTDMMRLNNNWSEGCEETDFEAPDSFYSKFFAWNQSFTTVPKHVERANPLKHISADDPPIWITHGTNDCVVPFSQSQFFYDALIAGGVNAKFFPVEGIGHTLEPYLRTELTQQVEAFLDEHLKGIAPPPQTAVHRR